MAVDMTPERECQEPRVLASAGAPPAALERSSPGARDLVRRLLDPEPRRRLRSLHNLQNIPFYMGFSFADARAKKLSPRDMLRRLLPDHPSFKSQPRTIDMLAEDVVTSFEGFDSAMNLR